MTLAKKIFSRIEELPEIYQAELLDFVALLETRSNRVHDDDERSSWSRFSLSQAMRSVDDEDDLYSLDDLVESF